MNREDIAYVYALASIGLKKRRESRKALALIIEALRPHLDVPTPVVRLCRRRPG